MKPELHKKHKRVSPNTTSSPATLVTPASPELGGGSQQRLVGQPDRELPAPLLNMTTITPHGFGFYDLAMDRQMILCDEGEWSGWLFYRHPDGQWVSLRKATDADINAITKQLIAAGWPLKKWQQSGKRDLRLSTAELCDGPADVPESTRSAEGPFAARMVRCRECVHWLCAHREWLENYSREEKPETGWVGGVCPVLLRRLDITASGGWDGATVDSVETDANFGCVFGEAPNDQAER